MSMMEHDKEQFGGILAHTLTEAQTFLAGLAERPAAVMPPSLTPMPLPDEPLGAAAALTLLMERYGTLFSGSAGGRYYGFVTGGSTPAALSGDWLTSTTDQNALGYPDSISPHLEYETVGMLLALFGLPETFTGTFVTGATMSNTAAMALARQWVGAQHGVNIAAKGLNAVPPIKVITGSAHASLYKGLSLIGLGRDSVLQVPSLPEREAIDVSQLEKALEQHRTPCIVVANAGTVDTVDFDAFAAIAELKAHYPFWLHIDAAFGGFASLSPRYAALLTGWDKADSITIDAHKWLNVPYDSAMLFTKHLKLQLEVFQNSAVYLGTDFGETDYVHRTPENSRRLRALPVWLTLQAYGLTGYREMLERHCQLAQELGVWLTAQPHFRLLAPVYLNGLCFTLDPTPTQTDINVYIKRLQKDGRIFLTPTSYKGTAALRMSLTNWRIQTGDIDLAKQALLDALLR